MSERANDDLDEPVQVAEAYRALLGELRGEIIDVNYNGGIWLSQGRYAEARRALDQAQALEALRDELVAWGRRLEERVEAWRPLVEESAAPGEQETAAGFRHPEEFYRAPILRALVEMGGRGTTRAVLDRVHEMVQERLTERDLAAVPSDPRRLSWQVTAQWSRNTMRGEGLIVAGSPNGVWEISDEGRRWLEQQR